LSPPDLDAYFAGCRARVPAFTRRHFGPLGTLRLHYEAIGLDLVRSPVNVLLVGPSLLLRLAAAALRTLRLEAAARWLATRRLVVETRLARRVAGLIAAELLGLDRLAEAAGRPVPHEAVEGLLAEYVAARDAVSELASGLLAIALSLSTLHVLAPSAFSLGPILAERYAEEEALSGFWAGRWAAGWYYSWWPAHASWSEIAAFTLGLMVVFSLVTTFMGLLTDPLQQALGLHDRRLQRLIATLERAVRTDAAARLALPDPYLSRIADLVDWVAFGLRYLR
jgi:hypothetical protein